MNAFKEKRILNSMSIEQAAEAMKVAVATISRWESGSGKPRVSFLKRVAEVYNCEIEDFLKEYEN